MFNKVTLGILYIGSVLAVVEAIAIFEISYPDPTFNDQVLTLMLLLMAFAGFATKPASP